MIARPLIVTLALVLMCVSVPATALELAGATSGYARNGNVNIHYATMGKGPLVVMVHGFPDYWYSWRHQMRGLAQDYQVVAMDQRGYNLSSAPEGDEPYAMRHLISDVAAVIRHFKKDKAIIVGHDWGGAVAWQFAYALPDMVDKLIVLNLPHPNGMQRAAMTNAEARAGSSYVEVFRAGKPSDPDVFFGLPMTAANLSGWVTEEAARPHYIAAFERSSFDAMLAYYKMNYPQPPEIKDEAKLPPPAVPSLNKQVLLFHGLEDTALHSDGLNNTWDWISQDLTIVTVPGAGHFVQQDAAELVTDTMRWWLNARRQPAN